MQTLVLVTQQWEWTPAQIAAEYDLSESQVQAALTYYAAHCAEIDAAIRTEQEMEVRAHTTPKDTP